MKVLPGSLIIAVKSRDLIQLKNLIENFQELVNWKLRKLGPIISLSSRTIKQCTVKPVISGHSKIIPKLVFMASFRLMQVKSIAECSLWSILQYFRPSLRYHLSLTPLLCLFLSGGLRQVLLYNWTTQKLFIPFRNEREKGRLQ